MDNNDSINFDEAKDVASVDSINFHENADDTIDFAAIINESVDFGSTDQAPIVDKTTDVDFDHANNDTAIDFGSTDQLDETAVIDFDHANNDTAIDFGSPDQSPVADDSTSKDIEGFDNANNNSTVDFGSHQAPPIVFDQMTDVDFDHANEMSALQKSEALDALVKFLSVAKGTQQSTYQYTNEELYEFLVGKEELANDIHLSNITLQTLDALLDLLFPNDPPHSLFRKLEEYLQSKMGNDETTTNNNIFERIGQTVTRVIKDKKPSKRIPLMSLVVKNATKVQAETALNAKISNREWSNANSHYMYPGPGEPLPEQIARIRRKRVRDEVITNFVEWLYASDLLESLSFGQKIVKYSNGFHFAIESIKRTDSYAAIIRRYARKWMAENSANDDKEDEELCCKINREGKRCSREEDHDGSCNFASERIQTNSDECGKRCPKSDMPCFKKKNHDGKHAYTPDDKLSPSTIARILSTLTNGEIKSLAGLDNIDVIKGHDNFESMREMVKKLVYIGRMDAGGQCELANLIQSKIDESEAFHKTIFPQHLGKPGSKHKCTCIQCGLSHGIKDIINCPLHGDHSPPCKECQLSFTMIGDLYDLHEEVYQKLQKNGTFITEPCLEDDLDTWKSDIKRYHTYLLDYRSHIVHKEDEGIFDAKFYRDLGEDECIAIFDYKMKIIASKHREAQIDWFAKRGFSCLGVLLIFGSCAENDENEVLYHFFLSDDTTQDTDAVNTAKHILYKNILPKYGVKKVHFRCDGAGAFNCAKSKAAMPRWPVLTNDEIVELTFKVMVSGCGKTSLDGLFGIMTQHLTRLINHGHSFSTAEELYDLLVEYPLRHSEFHLFQPKRTTLYDWTVSQPIKDIGMKWFYLLRYDAKKKCTTGFHHSRHSSGIHLKAVDEFVSLNISGKSDDNSSSTELSVQDDFDSMKATELKDLCSSLGLKKSGNKDVLKNRIRDHKKKEHYSDNRRVQEQNIDSDDNEASGDFSNSGKSGNNTNDGVEEEEVCVGNSIAYEEQLEETYMDQFEKGPEFLDNQETQSNSFDVLDPWGLHIVKSTWSDSWSSAMKEKGAHSKIDWQVRKLKKDKEMMERKNMKLAKKNQTNFDVRMNAGLFPCPCINDIDGERCLKNKFKTKAAMENHVRRCEDGKDEHLFPSRDLCSNILFDATQGKWALSLACGGPMANRCRALSKDVMVNDGSDTEVVQHEKIGNSWFSNGCYRRDMRERPSFAATRELLLDLELLYISGERRDGGGEKKNASKYTPAQALARLCNMKDEAGRRKYSFKEGNLNGPLPTEAYIRAWFSRRKSKKIKEGQDLYDAMSSDDLKTQCANILFNGINVNRKEFIIRMLVMDDGHNDECGVDYDKLSANKLDELRKDRELPGARTRKSYQFLLRTNDKLNSVNLHAEKVREQFDRVLAISDAMESLKDPDDL